MPKLIKNRQIIDDAWVVMRDVAELEDIGRFDGQDLIVPLPWWLENRGSLIAQRQGRTGVWLDSHELPEAIREDLPLLEVVALNFPVFSDGRPYSSARELRTVMGYQRELRAIGDVLRDQLFYMARCGFDSFAMREDQNLEFSLKAFDDFHEGYQSSVDRPVPLFRRRQQAS